MTFWHVDCVRRVSQTAFADRYRKWCKRHGYNFSAKDVEQIHREAREMIALVPKSATTKLLIQKAASYLYATSIYCGSYFANLRSLSFIILFMKSLNNGCHFSVLSCLSVLQL